MKYTPPKNNGMKNNSPVKPIVVNIVYGDMEIPSSARATSAPAASVFGKIVEVARRTAPTVVPIVIEEYACPKNVKSVAQP